MPVGPFFGREEGYGPGLGGVRPMQGRDACRAPAADKMCRARSRRVGWCVTCLRAGIAVALVGTLLGCKAVREPVSVPAELIGIWTTDDPRYLDRCFELTVDTITLGTGEGRQPSYPVQALQKSLDKGITSYRLTYTDPVEGVTDTLSFEYEPKDGGAIRLKHQHHAVWQKGGRS